jgi:hypothetical protein
VVAKLEALRASSTDSSVSVDDDRDNELKLAREAAQEQAAQWAAPHLRGTVAAAQTGADAPTMLRAGARATAMPPTVATGLAEIAAFTGGVALSPRTGTIIIMGSWSLSGLSVPVAGDLPSPKPTTSSEPR